MLGFQLELLLEKAKLEPKSRITDQFTDCIPFFQEPIISIPGNIVASAINKQLWETEIFHVVTKNPKRNHYCH